MTKSDKSQAQHEYAYIIHTHVTHTLYTFWPGQPCHEPFVNEAIPNGRQKHKAEAAEALLDGGDGRKSWGIIGYLE